MNLSDNFKKTYKTSSERRIAYVSSVDVIRWILTLLSSEELKGVKKFFSNIFRIACPIFDIKEKLENQLTDLQLNLVFDESKKDFEASFFSDEKVLNRFKSLIKNGRISAEFGGEYVNILIDGMKVGDDKFYDGRAWEIEVGTLGRIAALGAKINNWMNIERGIKWRGIADVQLHNRFITFNKPEDGLRAGIRITKTYYRKWNIRTVEQWVNRFAPSHENNVNAYARYVAKGTNSALIPKPDQKEKFRVFIKSVCEMEIGKWWVDENWADCLFETAWKLEQR